MFGYFLLVSVEAYLTEVSHCWKSWKPLGLGNGQWSGSLILWEGS